MALRISSDLAAQMLAHAAESPDAEVCGLLFGTVEEIVAVQPTKNIAANPETAFEIDSADLIAGHKAARADGRVVAGCYHSHPNGASEPSPIDRAQAERGHVWIIAAGGRLRAWHMDGEATSELELGIRSGS
jgi:desampylase